MLFRSYPQVLVNVHSDNKAGLDDCQPIWDAVAAAEKELDGRGRILVRPSGTEPLVRVMAEAETHELTPVSYTHLKPVALGAKRTKHANLDMVNGINGFNLAGLEQALTLPFQIVTQRVPR